MAVFGSELRQPERPRTLYIGAAVVVAALIGIILLVRYQRNHPTQEAVGPVVVEGMVREGDLDFEAYQNKVRIEDVKAYIGINLAGNRSAIIEGIIANEGSRKLEAMEMHILLYDVYGNLSKERTVIPLRPGIGLRGPMEPLEKRTFSVGIDGVDQLYDPKRVEIEITGLKYN